MEVTFEDQSLDDLEVNPDARSKHCKAIVRAYRKTMRFIRDATDERDLYSWPGGRFERKQGDRSHQHAFWLNDQWRLIVEIRKGTPKNTIHVVEIIDYHK